jgi:hypothetical protein
LFVDERKSCHNLWRQRFVSFLGTTSFSRIVYYPQFGLFHRPKVSSKAVVLKHLPDLFLRPLMPRPRNIIAIPSARKTPHLWQRHNGSLLHIVSPTPIIHLVLIGKRLERRAGVDNIVSPLPDRRGEMENQIFLEDVLVSDSHNALLALTTESCEDVCVRFQSCGDTHTAVETCCPIATIADLYPA